VGQRPQPKKVGVLRQHPLEIRSTPTENRFDLVAPLSMPLPFVPSMKHLTPQLEQHRADPCRVAALVDEGLEGAQDVRPAQLTSCRVELVVDDVAVGADDGIRPANRVVTREPASLTAAR
jgi:hypothetical protein